MMHGGAARSSVALVRTVNILCSRFGINLLMEPGDHLIICGGANSERVKEVHRLFQSFLIPTLSIQLV